MQQRSQAGFKPWGLCGLCLRPLGHHDASVFLFLLRDIWLESQEGRHRGGDPSVRQHPFWSKGTVSSPLSHFWHILCFYFVPIWLAGDEGLIPLVSLFWMVDGDSAGRGLSTHSCLIHSLYTSRVPLHPHCPCYCQMSISEQHCV